MDISDTATINLKVHTVIYLFATAYGVFVFISQSHDSENSWIRRMDSTGSTPQDGCPPPLSNSSRRHCPQSCHDPRFCGF